MSDRLEAAVAELVAAIRAEIVAPAVAMPERLLDIDSASTMLGIGRTAIYTEIQGGRLRSVKVGRRRLVPASAIASYIAAGGRDDDARLPAS